MHRLVRGFPVLGLSNRYATGKYETVAIRNATSSAALFLRGDQTRILVRHRSFGSCCNVLGDFNVPRERPIVAYGKVRHLKCNELPFDDSRG